eukprot:scaffold28583_cov52-Phaeocystis_antarctica.AAC.1
MQRGIAGQASQHAPAQPLSTLRLALHLHGLLGDYLAESAHQSIAHLLALRTLQPGVAPQAAHHLDLIHLGRRRRRGGAGRACSLARVTRACEECTRRPVTPAGAPAATGAPAFTADSVLGRVLSQHPRKAEARPILLFSLGALARPQVAEPHRDCADRTLPRGPRTAAGGEALAIRPAHRTREGLDVQSREEAREAGSLEAASLEAAVEQAGGRGGGSWEEVEDERREAIEAEAVRRSRPAAAAAASASASAAASKAAAAAWLLRAEGGVTGGVEAGVEASSVTSS